MSNSLVSLQQKALDLEKEVISNDGELSPALELELDLTSGELATKVDSYKTYIDYLEMRAEYFSALCVEASKYKKTLENLVKNLESRLEYAMIVGETTELRGHQYRFKRQASKDKLIIDMLKLPEQYVEEVSEIKPLKEAIRLALEGGIEVPGAKLEPSFHIKQYLLTSKNK